MCSHTLLGRTIFCMSKKYFLKLPVQIQFFNLSQKKNGMDPFICNIKLNCARILIS